MEMYIIGTLVGGAVGVFLLSIFISWVLRVIVSGRSQWERMKLGVPLGTLASVVISYFGTSGPYQAEEWPPMVASYLLSGFFWFIVAWIVSKNEEPISTEVATDGVAIGTLTFSEYKKKMRIERPGFSHLSKTEQVSGYNQFVAKQARPESASKDSELSSASSSPASIPSIDPAPKVLTSQSQATYTEQTTSNHDSYTATTPPPLPRDRVENNDEKKDIEHRLKLLHKLVEKGIISQEEAKQKRAEILAEV